MSTTTTTTEKDTTAPAKAGHNDAAGIGAQLAPWGAMGALVVAAGAARLAIHVTGADAEVAAGTALTAFTVAVVLAHATRRRITSRPLRQRMVAAVYLAAGWLSVVTATGLSMGAVAALVVLGAGLSLLYWRQHRIPNPQPPRGRRTDDDQDGDGDLFADRWRRNLGGTGKQLVGSRLTDMEMIRGGYRYTLRLVPGTHTVEQVRGMGTTLRGGLELLPGQDFIVEEHPTEPAPTGLLTILTCPPVSEKKLWPGPERSFDTRRGAVNLGPFADGQGVAHFGVYKRGGMFGGYAQGGTGSGKSRIIETVCMSLTASTSHPTVIWYADGQGGSSSPMLTGHADWAATTFDAIRDMLIAAVRVMDVNRAENRANKWAEFHPGPDRRGLLVVVDECHKVFDKAQNPHADECFGYALTIAREGRKVGVALLMASQSPTLDAFGGASKGNGADTLRSCLLDGNGLILRSKTSNAKQVFGVDIDPRSFPALPGYGYLCDPEEGARSAPFRAYFVSDKVAAEWAGRVTWLSLLRRQANAAGKRYARRHEVAEQQEADDMLLLQMADAGSLDDLYDGAEAMRRQAVAPAQGGGDAHPPVAEVERFWLAPQQRTAEPVRVELNTGQRKVLDAIRAGRVRPKDIQDATGYSESQVYNLLGELTKLGHIAKAGYGRYEMRTAA